MKTYKIKGEICFRVSTTVDADDIHQAVQLAEASLSNECLGGKLQAIVVNTVTEADYDADT